MINSSTSGGQRILQGIPTSEIYPFTTNHLFYHPSYISATVHIPAEIEDQVTIDRLTSLNHFLINMRHDFYGGVIQGGYIQSLQRELNETPAELLSQKLDLIINREYNFLTESYNDNYYSTFGAMSPIDFRTAYAEWCHSWYLQTLNIPSPLENSNLSWVFSCFSWGFASYSILACWLFLFVFYRGRKKKKIHVPYRNGCFFFVVYLSYCRIPDYPDAYAGWNALSSFGSYISVVGICRFFVVVTITSSSGKSKRCAPSPWAVEQNPTTLEWMVQSPPAFHTFGELPAIKETKSYVK